MSTKVETAVAKRDEELSGLTRMVEHYSTDFARVLPSHIEPGTFVRLAQGVLRRNADLAAAAKANPHSLLAALLECAELGHRPGSDQYALTFRRVKPDKNSAPVPTIIGIEQYQGEIERMYRAGGVLAVKARVVREHDFYDFNEASMSRPDHRPGYYVDNTTGRHARFAGAKARGALVAVYAYAEMQGGATSRVVEMDREEVMKHRDVAATTNIWDGPFEASMWLKTAVHELEKWVPTSSEYLQERARAMAAAQHAAPPPAPAEEPPAPGTVEGSAIETPAAVDPPGGEWPEPAQPGSGGGQG